MSLRIGISKLVNVKFSHYRKTFGDNPFTLLDVGAGNHSASKTKEIFPNCRYYGLDLDRNTTYSSLDFEVMEEFYELDFTTLKLDLIPDQFFDYINMAHVIEHLHNGDLVLPEFKKLKPNGYFYLEYPGPRSTKLPSMYGTLNFYDDPTHVRIYSLQEIIPLFESNHFKLLEAGTRRNYFYILATPFRILLALLQGRKLEGNLFWDLLGFAEFTFAQKMT